MGEHWFWLLVVIFTLGWYSTITFIVGYKGTVDIKKMLTKLSQPHEETEDHK